MPTTHEAVWTGHVTAEVSPRGGGIQLRAGMLVALVQRLRAGMWSGGYIQRLRLGAWTGLV